MRDFVEKVHPRNVRKSAQDHDQISLVLLPLVNDFYML